MTLMFNALSSMLVAEVNAIVCDVSHAAATTIMCPEIIRGYVHAVAINSYWSHIILKIYRSGAAWPARRVTDSMTCKGQTKDLQVYRVGRDERSFGQKHQPE